MSGEPLERRPRVGINVPAFSSADLGAQFIAALFVSGASITVFGQARHQSTICSTDSRAARAETLQFELGEGPHWEVLQTGQIVLETNLSALPRDRWPLWSNTVQRLGIAAVFAFPMKVGAATVGVVDLHCTTPRRLDAHQVSLASSMANRIAVRAVHIATNNATSDESIDRELAPWSRREVHQATGILQSQLNITATDAFARLRARAFSTNRPVVDLASDMVAGRLDFTATPE